jgi:hypothetical protein
VTTEAQLCITVQETQWGNLNVIPDRNLLAQHPWLVGGDQLTASSASGPTVGADTNMNFSSWSSYQTPPCTLMLETSPVWDHQKCFFSIFCFWWQWCLNSESNFLYSCSMTLGHNTTHFCFRSLFPIGFHMIPRDIFIIEDGIH